MKLTLLCVFLFCVAVNADVHGCPVDLECPVEDDSRINLSPDSIICAQDLCDVINDPIVLFIDVRPCNMIGDTPPINGLNWMNLPMGEIDAALNMTYSDFQQKYHHAMPQQDERIVVYCQTSIAASQALEILRFRGFTNAVHFPGSSSRWQCLKQDQTFCPEEINDRQHSNTCEIINNDHDDHEMAHFDCEQYYGHNDRCNQIKAYFCDQASWRINFFTQWMHDFLQFRSQHGLPELDMPECQDHQVECRNEGMQMCHTAVNGCEICYCADHEYENMQQLDGMWRRDYQRWSHVQQEWRQMWQNSQQASDNNNNNEGDC
jgi:rhodanese-related sulfurtransferase